MRVRFVLRNLSKHPVKGVIFESAFGPTAVLRAGDGTVYDPDQAFFAISPPVSRPQTLHRGAKLVAWASVLIRWSGPLQVTPECVGKPLPVLQVGVTAPGPPSDEAAAIAEVVAAAGHLLDQCRPQTPGVPVEGQINPPSGSVPPMSAQCSVSLGSEGSFWVAQVLILSPPGLSEVTIGSPYETLASTTPPSPPYEAIAWEFVVTRERAIPVVASDEVAASYELTASWVSTPSGWQGGGETFCPPPGWGGHGIGLTPGPQIWLISNSNCLAP